MSNETSSKLLFPWKLHRLLDESMEKGYENIISWTNGGRSFRVHNKGEFTARVMPLYFDTGKFKSFQRSLNLWGFRTITKGESKGDCGHPSFVRGRPDLCARMQRVRVRGSLVRSVAIYQDRRAWHCLEGTGRYVSTAHSPRAQTSNKCGPTSDRVVWRRSKCPLVSQ